MSSNDSELEVYKRALAREKLARKAAEKILEDKSTELYNTAQELKRSNHKLQKILTERTLELQGVFENIIDAYIVMDLWGNVIKMNEAAANLLGFDSYEDFNLLSVADVSEVENVMNAFDVLLVQGSVTDFRVKLNTKSGAQILTQVNASIILNENGEPIAAQGILRDVTLEKQAKDKLKQSENRLLTLISNLETGILLEDENRRIILVNQKFCDMFRLALNPKELVGKDSAQIFEQSKTIFRAPKGFITRVNVLLKSKKVVIGDELNTTKGDILERDFIPIISDNEYKGNLWSYRDVTLKRHYRQSIEIEKEKYRSIIANMHLGLVEIDEEGRVLMANQSYLNMSGYTEDEIIGEVGKDILLAKADRDMVESQMEKRKKGVTNAYEVKIRNKKGELRHWLLSGAPNYNVNGKISGSIGIIYDITELKELHIQKESLLLELEKSNNELQEYAHIVSHDLKSPLRSIDALLQWIKEDNKDSLDELSLQNINLIEVTLEKMEQLISDILEYSSIGSSQAQKKPVDLNDLVEGLVKILYVPNHIEIKISHPLPTISGDKTKLQQLFQNLISNAVKFIDKPEGRIEIAVKDLSDYYEFSIQDNGMGIEKRFHDKIFKIFHALNKSKDSTGVGLSIVKKIVELHSGKIWLESTPNVGTTFYFTLKK
ncbi:PAS domain-containing sensor histidine kinase [Winogradskyella sediminis]|uniref:histidine kinase n=1 Tax=Winogradskyella sediminis TaxID=1382466 RepID=A0A1H1QMD6_9FLAO|nr:PAS domain-containing sensor histidine kinase [Winogradskyella sediminis]SDS24630.1 PAS domain S-box-containing protein [Winogradskyella sediminis]